MAMILDAFMFKFSKLLLQMVQDEVGMLLGIPGEIEKLEKTVGDIQCVVADAEKKQIESKAIDRWLMELKDVMYDADDIMDLCQIKVQQRLDHSSDSPSSSKLGCGFLNPISCFRDPVFAHKIGTKIKEINLRLKGIAKRITNLGLIELQIAIGCSHACREDTFLNLQADAELVSQDIVGEKIENDSDLLISWLTGEEEGVKEKVSVVAIVGMGGIGKTTLAKKIFNDPKMEEFQLKVWICVSKMKGIDVLKCVIRQAGGDHGALQERSELVSLLKNLVKEKKFLLVLDDVWPENIQFWDGLLRAPLMDGAQGSGLLVTTRDDGVANSMMAIKLHRVEKLSDEAGWSLLLKQVFRNEDEKEIKQFKDLGLQLVEKCDGLPLAIKSMGGLLRTKSKTLGAWQAVLRNTTWTKPLQANVHHAFYLSYEDLPSPLKQCFIMCSLYPEDYIFNYQSLVYLWFAEGFLQDNENLWELGREYYRGLLQRNLLEVNENIYDPSQCKMHDLLWSFARYLGENENAILREGDGIPKRESSSKLRRLSIEEHEVNSKKFNKEKWLRTLLIDNIHENALVDVCRNLSNLRILALSKSDISTLPDSLGALKHLRYLDVSFSKIQIVPESIGYLVNLVYLNFNGCIELSHVPPSIINLKQLRFLGFFRTRVGAIPEGLKNLEGFFRTRVGAIPEGLKNLENLISMVSSQTTTIQTDLVVSKN